MTRPDARTVITPQLIGRWIASIGALIRDPANPDRSAIAVGQWDNMTDAARWRLTEIGVDLMAMLDDAGVLTRVNRSLIPRVKRDHTGRRLGSPVPDGAPADSAPSCVCGRASTLGVVHRIDGPCFVYTPQAGSTDLRTALGPYGDKRMRGTAERVDLGDDPDGDMAAQESERPLHRNPSAVRPTDLDAVYGSELGDAQPSPQSDTMGGR
jgi:hypothetical protein